MSLSPPSEVFWLTATVYQEAQGEPKEGKRAVAWVVMNRCRARNWRVPEIVFEPKQFSCWNEDSRTRTRLASINGTAWWESSDAAEDAFYQRGPDPTVGATHYLNEELTKRIRGGTLPSWFREEAVTARIGQHTFLRLGY